MKRLTTRILLVGSLMVAAIVGFAAPAAAQDDDTRPSVSVGAAALRWLDFTGFTTKGVVADVVKPIGSMPNWGIVGDFGFLKEGGDVKETDITALGGIRFAKRHGRVVFFGQGLFGIVHWSDTDEGGDNGIAVVPGGGAIIEINDMIGIKGQVDYFLMHWNNFDDGNLFRYLVAVNIKLGKKK